MVLYYILYVIFLRRLKSSKLLIASVLLMTLVLITYNSAHAVSYIPPNPPINLVATPYSATQINLSWSAPDSNDGPSLTAYKIVYAMDNGNFQDLVSRDPTTTSYSHTNLMPGHIYTYEVFALNSVGTSNPSNIVTQTTLQGTLVPSAPTSLTAIASSPTSIFLSWNSPQSNGGSPITGYEIEYGTTTVQWLVLIPNTGNAQQTYFYHTGIDSSKTYYYRVSAINSNGVGAPSNIASSIITPTTTPAITGVAISPTQVNLSWVAPSNTFGQIINGYQIQQKSGTSYINLVENTGLVTSYTISSLTPDTTYTFRIKALFTGGTSSAGSTDVSVTPTSASYNPSAQQNNLPSSTSVYLGQQSPGNANNVVFTNSGPQTQYFSSPSAQVYGIWTTVSTYVVGTVLYFDSNGNTYSATISPNSNMLISFSSPMSISNVRVSIHDRGYSNDMASVAYVSVSQPSPSVPDAPQSLFASLYSQNNAQLSWTAPQNSGKSPISGYKIEYKTTSGTWSVLNQNIGISTVYLHSGLLPSNTYTYRVSAINSAGTGMASNEASVNTGYFTNPQPTFSQITTGTIPVGNTDTSTSYVISGGQVFSATVNKDTSSLDIQLQGKTGGILYLQLPRTLIDAKQSDGSDRTFYVTVDNQNVKFDETKTATYRTLEISFPNDASKMSIVGTSVVPEFPIALIGLVIGLVPAIVISRRFVKSF
jgi:Fibronectin type III domain